MQQEIDRIGDATVYARFRTAGTGAFDSPVALSKNGNSYNLSSRQLVADTEYDVQVYYVDDSGNTVISQWHRFTTAPTANLPGDSVETYGAGQSSAPSDVTQIISVGNTTTSIDNSLTRLASEVNGRITGTITALDTEPGLVQGPVDVSSFEIEGLSQLESAGSISGISQVGALTGDNADLQPYYTAIEYNDLGYVVASNEEGGLWRRYGVDAMGSKVHTTLLGDDRGATSGIESYTRFDGRGNAIFKVGPEGTAGRAITEEIYDYEGRLTQVYEAGNFTYSEGVRTAVTYTDLMGNQYEAHARRYFYDDAGNLIGENDALDNYTSYYYDLLGNLIRSEDASGDVEIFDYDYSGGNSNRLTMTYFVGAMDSTRQMYGYDSFGRRTISIKVHADDLTSDANTGLRIVKDDSDKNSRVEGDNKSAVSRVTYNQGGEVTRFTDAEGRDTNYWYNRQGAQEWIQDDNGRFFGRSYDAMGRLVKEYAFNTNASMTLTTAKSRAASGHGTLVVEESIYDIFGNLIASISLKANARIEHTASSQGSSPQMKSALTTMNMVGGIKNSAK